MIVKDLTLTLSRHGCIIQVHQLTPRLCKPLFAANPLRSDLYGLRS